LRENILQKLNKLNKLFFIDLKKFLSIIELNGFVTSLYLISIAMINFNQSLLTFKVKGVYVQIKTADWF